MLKATQAKSSVMMEVVKLPLSTDRGEWLAINLMEFFNAITMIYSLLEDFCTDEACPKMTATPKVGLVN